MEGGQSSSPLTLLFPFSSNIFSIYSQLSRTWRHATIKSQRKWPISCGWIIEVHNKHSMDTVQLSVESNRNVHNTVFKTSKKVTEGWWVNYWMAFESPTLFILQKWKKTKVPIKLGSISYHKDNNGERKRKDTLFFGEVPSPATPHLSTPLMIITTCKQHYTHVHIHNLYHPLK